MRTTGFKASNLTTIFAVLVACDSKDSADSAQGQPLHEVQDEDTSFPDDGAAEGDEDSENPATVDRPEDQTDQQPCGDDTLAQVTAENGNVVTFCVFDNGTAAVGELGLVDVPSAIDGVEFTCLSELFQALAPPDQEVPPELLAFCSPMGDDGADQDDGEHVELAPDLPLVAEREPSQNHYCAGGGAGATAFINERCNPLCANFPFISGCDAFICQQNLVASHQRTCLSAMPDKCGASRDEMASCGETSLHRLWVDGGFSGPPNFSSTVPAGYWHAMQAYVDTVGFEQDSRYRGDQYNPGSSHRYVVGMES